MTQYTQTVQPKLPQLYTYTQVTQQTLILQSLQ